MSAQRSAKFPDDSLPGARDLRASYARAATGSQLADQLREFATTDVAGTLLLRELLEEAARRIEER